MHQLQCNLHYTHTANFPPLLIEACAFVRTVYNALFHLSTIPFHIPAGRSPHPALKLKSCSTAKQAHRVAMIMRDRVVDINLDVAQARINLEKDKFLRRRASRRVAAKRLYQRDPAVIVCANGVLEQWVAVSLLLVLWLHRVRSAKRSKVRFLKVCTAVEICALHESTRGGRDGVCEGTGMSSPREKTVRFVSHLSEVIRQRLIMSGDVELNPGPLDGMNDIVLTSLVPRPFERKRKKGLVHTVCACSIFPVNSYICPFISLEG